VVHELEPKLIVTTMHGQQHIKKFAPTCFGSHKTIIREPHPALRKNYISGTNVRVVIDVVSVMAAYATITLTT